MKLITQELRLKDLYPEKAKEIAKKQGIKTDDVPFIRKGITPGDLQFEDGERAVISYINTGVKDRDNEIVEPAGAILEDYRKHPVVLFAHRYHELPIGKNEWIKSDEKGLVAKTIYAKHEEADKIYNYRKDGFPLAESIGFVPFEWEDYEGKDGNPPKDGVRRRYTKWLLLEYSDVPVPSNPEALQVAISKGLIKEDEVKHFNLSFEKSDETIVKKFALVEPDEDYGLQDPEHYKGAIPFKATGKEPEDAAWDAGKEVKEAEVADLKIMCAWVNSDEPDMKTSYKLPHHRAKGHNAVWRAVAAAMAALLGARGGVRIPAEDRQGVYNHLAKHYKQFDKEPPEFKEYDEPELREMFEDVWFEELGDIVTMEMELGEIDEKSGRVLSEKNRTLVKKCADLLLELYNASEPAEEGDKELTEKEKKAISGIGKELAKITESIKGGKDNDV